MINKNLNLMGLIDTAPMCIKLFDGDGNIIFINKFGRHEHHILDNDDISKWDWLGTIKAQYQEDVKSKLSKIVKEGSLVEYVEFEHTKEGSDHEWCSGAISSVKDENGATSGILFYSIDSSARKNAEKAEKEKMNEIEKMNNIMIDRELKMIDLKKQIENLKAKFK